MAKIVKMHAGGARIAVRALAAFAAFFLALAPRLAEAGFTRVKSIDKGGRQTLDDQTIYRLDSNDVTVNAVMPPTTVGGSRRRFPFTSIVSPAATAKSIPSPMS